MAHELARATRAHKRECHDPRLPFLHRLFARSALRTTRWSHVDPVLACARAKARRPLHAPTDAILLREKKIDRDRALKKPLEHDARRYTRLGVAGRQLPLRASRCSLFTVRCSEHRARAHTHTRVSAWPAASCRLAARCSHCSLFTVHCSEHQAHIHTRVRRGRSPAAAPCESLFAVHCLLFAVPNAERTHAPSEAGGGSCPVAVGRDAIAHTTRVGCAMRRSCNTTLKGTRLLSQRAPRRRPVW